MQLTDDEIKEIADWFSMLPNSVQVTQFARAIESALSAQADARPVAWESTAWGYRKYLTQEQYERIGAQFRKWYKPYRCSNCSSGTPIYQVRLANGDWRDQTEQSYMNNQQHCASDTRIVYTHPEASTPGLSREDSDLLRELLYRVEYDPGSPTEEKLHQAYEIITRVRAATLRLPPTTGLPQAAYCASAATVAEPRKYPLAQGYQSYGDGGDCEQAEPVVWRWRDNPKQQWIITQNNPRQMDYGFIEPLYTHASQQAEPGADEREREALAAFSMLYAACTTAMFAMGKDGANASVMHPLREAWEQCREAEQTAQKAMAKHRLFSAQSGQLAGAAEDARDAARWRTFERALRTGHLRGTAYGHRFKIIETCSMSGDEKEFNAFVEAIDAAIAAAPTQQQEPNK